MLKRILVILLLSLGIIPAVGGWALFFSGLPAQWGATELRDRGVEIYGEAGTVSSGLSANRIKLKSPSGDELVAEGIKVTYTGAFKLLFGKRLVVDDVTAEKATLTVKSYSLPGTPQKKKFNAPAARNEAGQGSGLAETRFGKITITNLFVKFDGMQEPVGLEKVVLDDLVASGSTWSLREFSLNGPYADASGRGMKYDSSGQITLDEKVSGVIKSDKLGNYLRKNSNFALMYEKNGDKVSADLMTLDEKIRIQWVPDTGAVLLTIRGLTPKDYLNTDVSITDIQAQLNATSWDLAEAGLFSGKASLRLGEALFESEVPGTTPVATPGVVSPTPTTTAPAAPAPVASTTPGVTPGTPPAIAPIDQFFKLFYSRDPIRYTMTIKVPKRPEGTDASTPLPSWISIGSNQQGVQKPSDALADLFYKVPYDKLDPTQKAGVDKEAAFYGFVAPDPASIVAITPPAPAPGANTAGGQRKPAAASRK